MNVVRRLQLLGLFLLSAHSAADELSVDDMIGVIVEEQFVAQQQFSVVSTLETLFQSMGLKVDSSPLMEVFDPYLKKYVDAAKTKGYYIYREVYSDDEITAIYKFVTSDIGKSVSGKQGDFLEDYAVNFEDSVRLQQDIANVMQQNSSLIESILNQEAQSQVPEEPTSIDRCHSSRCPLGMSLEPMSLEPMSLEPMPFDLSFE